MSVHTLWVEKYRPTSVSEYIFHDSNHRTFIEQMIRDKSIPHLLLCGVQGSGKSTIAQILVNHMGLDDSDVLTINASLNRGIDMLRDTVSSFASTVGSGAFKIIHFEEANRLTPEAQDALKAYMEDNCDHIRFIFTCNNSNLIIPPIRSRCQDLHFKAPNADDIAMRLVQMLAAERVKASIEVIDQYIVQYYPDIRKIINAMQQWSTDGKLSAPMAGTGEYRLPLIECMKKKDWIGARTFVVQSVTSDQWDDLYRFLYMNIYRVFPTNTPQWNSAILVIADHLYKHALCADPEINAAAMFIELSAL